jgi:predicted PhzF superfamily epimerase YddE/YHI9
MARLHVLRVFLNDEGEWGNLLGVFLDGAQVHAAERQRVAAELGFSETVFVDDPTSNELRIFTPAVELPFAGHPLVGTAWLLEREGRAGLVLHPPAGEVKAGAGPRSAWIAAPPEWSPRFEYRRLDSPAAVHALSGSPGGGWVYAWAWIDEDAGTVRARSFVPEAGIEEDEATGAAALALCGRLGRPITVHQGHGSVINARPLEDGRVQIGGLVACDAVREHRL